MQTIDGLTAGDAEQHFGAMTTEDIQRLLDSRPGFEAYGDWYQNLFDDDEATEEVRPAALVR